MTMTEPLLELATPLLAEALPMPPEQAVITALGRRIKAEVKRIFAAGVSAGRKQAAADIRNYPGPDPSPANATWWAGYKEAQEEAARIAEGTNHAG